MAIFLLIAIIPLFTLMIWACSRNGPDEMSQFQQSNGDDEVQTNPMISFDDVNIDSTLYCRRVLQFLLQFFSLFLMWVASNCFVCDLILLKCPVFLLSFCLMAFAFQSLNYCHVHNQWTHPINHFKHPKYREIIIVRHRNL